MKKDIGMTREAVQSLFAAIVEQAAKDYVRSLRTIRDYEHGTERYRANAKQRTKYERAVYMKEECERFFLYDAETFVDIDGGWMINELRKKVNDKNFKT